MLRSLTFVGTARYWRDIFLLSELNRLRIRFGRTLETGIMKLAGIVILAALVACFFLMAEPALLFFITYSFTHRIGSTPISISILASSGVKIRTFGSVFALAKASSTETGAAAPTGGKPKRSGRQCLYCIRIRACIRSCRIFSQSLGIITYPFFWTI